jgi:hypothetical protein
MFLVKIGTYFHFGLFSITKDVIGCLTEKVSYPAALQRYPR